MIRLEQIPEELRHLVARATTLEHPPQGMTSEVAFAGDVVVKRATKPLYRDWLRREHRVVGYLDGGDELWLLTGRLRGELLETAVERGPARATRERLLADVGAQLARLHATPIPELLLDDRPFLDRTLAEAESNLRNHPDELDGGTPELLDCLLRTRPPDVPPRLIHGDFRPDNILVEGDRVVAFVDWSGGGSGDPRMDVAFIRSDLGDTAAFDEGYGAPPIDPIVQRWFLDLYDFF